MTRERRRYQYEVARLLDAIREGVAKLERLRAGGARGPALAQQESELAEVRGELAALVGEQARAPVRSLAA